MELSNTTARKIMVIGITAIVIAAVFMFIEIAKNGFPI